MHDTLNKTGVDLFSADTLGDNKVNSLEDLVFTASDNEDDVSKYFEFTTPNIKVNLSDEYKEYLLNGKSYLTPIAHEMELLTRLKEEIISGNRLEIDDIYALENIRVFSTNSFSSRGMFYCESIPTLYSHYDFLADSMIYATSNDAYTDRYMYPICLPDGTVFTFMGYSYEATRNDTLHKYEIPQIRYINQRTLLGNMESLSLYNGNVVYVTEGYFDAIRINDEWGKKSVCIFGSNLTTRQRNLLYLIKQQGHMLVYVRDMDEAGEKISRDPVWDDVFIIPSTKYKDIDEYVREQYKDVYQTKLHAGFKAYQHNLHSMGKLNIDFYNESNLKCKLKVIKRTRNKNTY